MKSYLIHCDDDDAFVVESHLLNIPIACQRPVSITRGQVLTPRNRLKRKEDPKPAPTTQVPENRD